MTRKAMDTPLRNEAVVAVVDPRTDTAPRRHAPGPALIIPFLFPVEGRPRFARDRVPVMPRRQQVGDLPLVPPVEIFILVVAALVLRALALESRSDLLQPVLGDLLLIIIFSLGRPDAMFIFISNVLLLNGSSPLPGLLDLLRNDTDHPRTARGLGKPMALEGVELLVEGPGFHRSSFRGASGVDVRRRPVDPGRRVVEGPRRARHRRLDDGRREVRLHLSHHPPVGAGLQGSRWI
mmetsp:Transcript_13985/g.37149  ORF Transcript_13985/g.37149 Transcript_13985/m.37149 type:complete len:236 (-) Transcript_13985:112-819(-)